MARVRLILGCNVSFVEIHVRRNKHFPLRKVVFYLTTNERWVYLSMNPVLSGVGNIFGKITKSANWPCLYNIIAVASNPQPYDYESDALITTPSQLDKDGLLCCNHSINAKTFLTSHSDFNSTHTWWVKKQPSPYQHNYVDFDIVNIYVCIVWYCKMPYGVYFPATCISLICIDFYE
jgi:hypothetical protein